jgi:hypothetical protein
MRSSNLRDEYWIEMFLINPTAGAILQRRPLHFNAALLSKKFVDHAGEKLMNPLMPHNRCCKEKPLKKGVKLYFAAGAVVAGIVIVGVILIYAMPMFSLVEAPPGYTPPPPTEPEPVDWGRKTYFAVMSAMFIMILLSSSKTRGR